MISKKISTLRLFAVVRDANTVVRLLTESIIDNNRISPNRIFTSVYDMAF